MGTCLKRLLDRCLRLPGPMLLVSMEITQLQHPWTLRFDSKFGFPAGPLSFGCLVVGVAIAVARRPG